MTKEIKHLIENSLCYKPDERICLIHDGIHCGIANKIINYCEKNNIPLFAILSSYISGGVVPNDVKKCFLGDSFDIILLAMKENVWHTEERKRAKYEKKKRLVNLLHPDEPCKSYLADISKMKSLGIRLEQLLRVADKVIIYSESGTEVEARIGRVFAETGDYSLPGSGGDFPAGEVGFGPLERSVNGKIVYDFKIQHVGFVRDNPHIIGVWEDKINPFDVSLEFQYLIDSHEVLEYISEISLGINHIWSETDNEHSIIEEKNLGTVHFGHGGNLSYGSRKGPHFDAVILKPTVYLDNLMVLKEGVLTENI